MKRSKEAMPKLEVDELRAGDWLHKLAEQHHDKWKFTKKEMLVIAARAYLAGARHGLGLEVQSWGGDDVLNERGGEETSI